jgi:hypothetical protein
MLRVRAAFVNAGSDGGGQNLVRSVNRVLFVPGLTVLEVHYDGHTSVGGYGVTASSSRLHCWVESLVLGLGIPSAIWAVSPVISVSIPAAVHVPGGARLLLAERGRSGRVAICSRTLVCAAAPRTFLPGVWRLAFRNLASMVGGAATSLSLDR